MGKRGPAPKPLKLKLLGGNAGKRPLNKREPAPPRGVPRCPDWLGAVAKAKWRALVPVLDRMGLLTLADGDTLAAFCVACEELRGATQILRKEGRVLKTSSGYSLPHPAVSMQRSAWQAIRAFSALFGLSPSGRVGLSVGGEPEKADPFDAFLRGKKPGRA